MQLHVFQASVYKFSFRFNSFWLLSTCLADFPAPEVELPLIACEQGWECFVFPALCFGGSGPQDPQNFCVQVDCLFRRPLLDKPAAMQSARARRHHERPCQGLGCVPVPLLPGRLFSHPRSMSLTPWDPSRCQATFPFKGLHRPPGLVVAGLRPAARQRTGSGPLLA